MTFEVRAAREGGWLAFASDGRLLVTGAADDTFVAAAWRAMQGPDAFRAALDVLTGRGLTATPAFVLADWGADPRLIVRGDVQVTVTGADGERALSAAGVATWIEQAVPGATGLSITVPGAVDADTQALPLASGVAFVASVGCGAASPPPTPAVGSAHDAAAPSAPIESTLAALPEQGAPTTAETAAQGDDGYDYLFGETMYRSVSDAAVRTEEPAPEGDPDDEPHVTGGDHDGHTVLTSDVAKLRGRRKPKARAAAKPEKTAELVVVVSTTGAREPLNQPLLVGRSPTVSQVPAGSLPRILAVDNDDHDVSRNHVQLALEGGTPVVTDLHSRNGTTIAMPGKKPQKLRAGEPTTVLVGTVVDLGGGLTLTIENA